MLPLHKTTGKQPLARASNFAKFNSTTLRILSIVLGSFHQFLTQKLNIGLNPVMSWGIVLVYVMRVQ